MRYILLPGHVVGRDCIERHQLWIDSCVRPGGADGTVCRIRSLGSTHLHRVSAGPVEFACGGGSTVVVDAEQREALAVALMGMRDGHTYNAGGGECGADVRVEHGWTQSSTVQRF